MSTKIQTFNDGLVKIYSVGNIAEKGNMPKDGFVEKLSLRYRERTVGMSRYWTASQAMAKIDRLLRVPRHDDVSTQDIAIPNDGGQYKIVQIQYIEDVKPPVMDLSIQRLENEYELTGAS